MQDSKILQRYKKSLFADIGIKTSVSKDMPISTRWGNISALKSESNKINNISKLNTLNSTSLINSNITNVKPLIFKSLFNGELPSLKYMKSIDLTKSTMDEIVLKPYNTLLNISSRFGSIIVTPYTSIVKMLDKINIPKPIYLNKASSLINSPIKSIIDSPISNKLLSMNSIFDDIFPMKESSVFSFKSPVLDLMNNSSVLDSISSEFKSIKQSSVLSLNSKFDDILLLNTDTILDIQRNFLFVDGFKTNSILKSEKDAIGNIIIKDIRNLALISYSKSGKGVISAVNFVPDINATGFSLNAPYKLTQFDMSTIPIRQQPDEFDFTENAELGKTMLDYYTADISTTSGFNIKDSSNFNESEFDLSSTHNTNLEAFDFKNRLGFLNQWAQFYPNNISPNTSNAEMSFQRYTEYLVRKMVAKSYDVLPKNFMTPMYAINNVGTIGGMRGYNSIPSGYWGYTNPSDKVPNSNQFVDALIGGTVTMATGLMSAAAMEGLKAVTGVDFKLMNTSPLGLHVIAGEIYWKMNGFDAILQQSNASSEGTVGTIASIIGTASRLLTIAGKTFLPSDILKSDTAEYALMVAHIIGGTKYTTAYAFYDPIAKQYSSKYNSVGNNALNWYYDDGNNAQVYSDSTIKYGSSPPDISTNKSFEQVKTSLQNPISTAIKTMEGISPFKSIDDSFKNSILNRFYRISTNKDEVKSSTFKSLKRNITGFEKIVNSIADVIKNPASIFDAADKINSDADTILGKEFVGLKNPVITKENSFTFGKMADKYAKMDEIKIPPLPMPEIPSVNLGSEIDSLKKIIGDASIIATPYITPSNGYQAKFGKAIEGKIYPRLLSSNNIPDKASPNNYSDAKNLMDLIKIGNKESYTDDDIIDFYFEDVTSDARKEESIIIPFRAILTGVNTNTSANWLTHDYVGRPDKFYIYGGFDKRINLSFDVAANSKMELMSMWRKINYLEGLCYPTSYPNGVSMTAPIAALTIGAVFQRVYCVINSVSIDFDSTTIWDIEKTATDSFQLPMYVKISVDLNILFDSLPITTSRRYAQRQKWIDPVYKKYNSSLNAIQQNSSEALSVTTVPGEANKYVNMA